MPILLLLVLLLGTMKRRPRAGGVDVIIGEPVIIERKAKPGW